VEQAFRILARLRKAHQRQKNLVDVIARHENELSSVKAIIGIIDDEEELHIPSVGGELVRLQEVQTRLAKLLEALDPKTKGKMNQIARQFVQGSADEKKLSGIMDELAHVKALLLLRIQVANVGVMRTVQKELVANAVVIQRIDDYLREHVSNCKGLRIARLLKDRRPSSEYTAGNILL
jgi:vacuolar-type H+-ATPase subunit I/STV1